MSFFFRLHPPRLNPYPRSLYAFFFARDGTSSSGMTVPARNSPRRVSAYAGEETVACTLQFRDVDPMTHQEENLRLCTKKKKTCPSACERTCRRGTCFSSQAAADVFPFLCLSRPASTSQTCPILSLPNPLSCLVISNAGGHKPPRPTAQGP